MVRPPSPLSRTRFRHTPFVVAALVACATVVPSTLSASAATATAGGSCPKVDATSTAGGKSLVCKNTAKAGQRPRLRWAAAEQAAPATTAPAAAPTPTTAAPKVTLTVYSGRTYGIEDVYKRYTKETGVELEIVTGSDPANRTRLQGEGARTPADVYLTVDIASLHRAAEDDLLAPLDSPSLLAAVPVELRDTKNRWFGLTRRARVIYVNTQKVSADAMPKTYEDLASPTWAGRLCMRPSAHVYTQSLAANIMAAYGSKATPILTGLAKNTKSENFIDSDTRIIETVNAGGCDAAIANTYYWFRPGLKNQNVKMIFPNQGDGERGVHVNVSGAGVVAASDNKAAAQKFIEWLANEGNADFANGNAEFAVNPKTVLRDEVKAISTFKADQGRIDDYSRLQAAALIVLTEAGWR
jgi:iron(III) transport system substrate-binding protein